MNFSVRELEKEETENALLLVWKVFQEYEAPDYTEEGIQEFYQSIHDENYVSQLSMYGAFLQEKLAGVIAVRNQGSHIALFFVDGTYHRQGIGRKLFETVSKKCTSDVMTVNSSPYAVPIYHRFGFQDTDIEQVINGLRFIPMKRHKIYTIREWRLSDAVSLAEILSNQKIQNNLRDGLPYPYTEKDGLEYINAMLSADKNNTFAFAVTADDKAVGSIAVFRQENVHRLTGELGYYIAENCWGRGIMTNAVKQICEYVFQNSDIIRIYAEPFAYNTASCRVLEKAGFQFEGLLRQNAVKNHKIIDMKLYALLKNTGETFHD